MFRAAWDAVRIRRRVPYSLFTFGESQLDYFLVEEAAQQGDMVGLSRGTVRVTRPMIITPHNAQPELQDFFEGQGEMEGMAQFLLARSAAFNHMQLVNRQGSKQMQSDSVEDLVARLTRRLDEEEEDHIAVLTAPHNLGGMAIFKYATERIMESAPDNIQELRERGFLD